MLRNPLRKVTPTFWAPRLPLRRSCFPAGPSFLADQWHETNIRQILLAKFVFRKPGDPDEFLNLGSSPTGMTNRPPILS